MDLAIWLGTALVGAIIAAIVQTQLPPDLIPSIFTRKSGPNVLLGKWDSSWGPSAEEIEKEHETITITRQSGTRIWGTARRATADDKDKEWELNGRFDGHFLQMLYYPSKNSPNKDFLDYGCYFFKKQGDGTMKGYSAGFGSDKGVDSVTAEHALMRRIA